MLFALLASLTTAQAADLVVGNAATATYTCEVAQRVVVKGNNLALTFNGDCGALEIQGNGNQVTIDGVTSVKMIGNQNTVSWKLNLSGAPKLAVTKLGTQNKATQLR